MTQINITVRVEFPERLVAAILEIAAKFGLQSVLPPPAPTVSPEMPENSDTAVSVIAEREDPDASASAVAESSGAVCWGKVWVPERKQLLVALRKQRLSFGEIWVRLNEMHGPPKVKTLEAVRAQYKKMRAWGEIKMDDLVGRGAPMLEDDGECEDDARIDPKTSGSVKIPNPGAVTQLAASTASESTLAVELRRALEEKRVEPAALPLAAPRKYRPISHVEPAITTNLKPMHVTIEYARQWAAERGLANGGEKFDIDKVNHKRKLLGLSEFIIEPASPRRRTTA